MRKEYLYAGIWQISATTLIFELTLTRLFAVAEWYHLAFLSISVALLGYASSGTLLALIRPALRARLAPYVGTAFPACILGSYLVVNWLPFDSYQLAWDPKQLLYLGIYYAALVAPFACGGYLTAHCLALFPKAGHKLYAANLLGSAMGAALLLFLLPALGGEGTILAAVALGALGAVGLALATAQGRRLPLLGAVSWLGIGLLLLGIRPAWIELRLSPYKSLSYALQAAGALLEYQRWNVISRIDVVDSPQIHSAPGLGLSYQGKLPPQYALSVDGGEQTPITRFQGQADTAFLAYLPTSVAYRLRPGASALILRPRGGLDVAVALAGGARSVQVVEENPLIVHVMSALYDDWSGGLYHDQRVTVRTEDIRSALRRARGPFDIVLFSLTDSYRPVGAGSFSLSENYVYTVESFQDALRQLQPAGLVVVTRWLQDPPSESIRAAAILVSALEKSGVSSPALHLAAFRSWSTMTLVASPSPLDMEDIEVLHQGCEQLGYDLVYYPGMRREEANRHHILPEPVYYDALQHLLFAADRRAFYRAQVYDVSPSTDNRPFFYHSFRWRQLSLILRQIGRVWQPFGGSGFLIILALLVLALLAAALLILVPLRRVARSSGTLPLGQVALYFAALGAGYMLTEIPLLQRFILYLGQPTLALIIILSALLLFSGVGSMLADRVPLRTALLALVITAIAYTWGLDLFFAATLLLAWGLRAVLAVLCLLPLGMLMGIPFAAGMRKVEQQRPGLIPWIWAANGSASVVSSILAAIVALSWGYRTVLIMASICYGAATAILWLGQITRPGSQSARSGPACGLDAQRL